MYNNVINYCVLEHSKKLYNEMLALTVSHYVNGQVSNECYVTAGPILNKIYDETVQLFPSIMLPGDSPDDTYDITKKGSTLFVRKSTDQDEILDSVPCMILGYPTPAGVVDLIDKDYVDLNNSDPRFGLKDVENFRETFYKDYFKKISLQLL